MAPCLARSDSVEGAFEVETTGNAAPEDSHDESSSRRAKFTVLRHALRTSTAELQQWARVAIVEGSDHAACK